MTRADSRGDGLRERRSLECEYRVYNIISSRKRHCAERI